MTDRVEVITVRFALDSVEDPVTHVHILNSEMLASSPSCLVDEDNAQIETELDRERALLTMVESKTTDLLDTLHS